MKTLFKPTAQIEMDLMKAILGDYSKLKFVILNFDNANDFWINQQNWTLYRLLQKEFNMLSSENEKNITELYDNAFNNLETTHPKHDLTLYDSIFETNFNFQETACNYFLYFKKKAINSTLKDLSIDIQTREVTEIKDELDALKSICSETMNVISSLEVC
jgi:predicted transcriptional regulator YdeE